MPTAPGAALPLTVPTSALVDMLSRRLGIEPRRLARRVRHLRDAHLWPGHGLRGRHKPTSDRFPTLRQACGLLVATIGSPFAQDAGAVVRRAERLAPYDYHVRVIEGEMATEAAQELPASLRGLDFLALLERMAAEGHCGTSWVSRISVGQDGEWAAVEIASNGVTPAALVGVTVQFAEAEAVKSAAARDERIFAPSQRPGLALVGSLSGDVLIAVGALIGSRPQPSLTSARVPALEIGDAA